MESRMTDAMLRKWSSGESETATMGYVSGEKVPGEYVCSEGRVRRSVLVPLDGIMEEGYKAT